MYLRNLGAAPEAISLPLHSGQVEGIDQFVVDELVDELIEAAKLAIPNYPEIARPPLLRRCDLSRMIGRYCGLTRKL
jgi:hypothetical protein